MNKIYENKDYYNIISDILDNEKFKKTDECIHHGLSRMDHSLKVSYYSYKLAKKFFTRFKVKVKGRQI